MDFIGPPRRRKDEVCPIVERTPMPELLLARAEVRAASIATLPFASLIGERGRAEGG
jgi:hypothetical protein